MEILSQTFQNAFHCVTETHCGPSEVRLFYYSEASTWAYVHSGSIEASVASLILFHKPGIQKQKDLKFKTILRYFFLMKEKERAKKRISCLSTTQQDRQFCFG